MTDQEPKRPIGRPQQTGKTAELELLAAELEAQGKKVMRATHIAKLADLFRRELDESWLKDVFNPPKNQIWGTGHPPTPPEEPPQ